jgi:hypothetical protein
MSTQDSQTALIWRAMSDARKKGIHDAPIPATAFGSFKRGAKAATARGTIAIHCIATASF